MGNPPYIPIEQIESKDRNAFKQLFPQLERKYDTSILFFLKGTSLLSDTGVLTYIAPLTWQTGENFIKFRKYIFESNGIKKIINLPFDMFESAYIDTGIYILSKSQTDFFKIYCFDKKCKNLNFDDISFLKLKKKDLDQNTYKIFFGNYINTILKKTNNEHFIKLGEISKSTQGLSASRFDRVNKTHKNSFKFLERGNVYNYKLLINSTSIVDMTDKKSLHQFYLAEPKILIRRIVSRQDRLTVGYTDDKIVFKKDINPFIPIDERFPAKYLLGIMASKLVSYIYVNFSTIATKDDFRQTTLAELRSLPIPIATKREKTKIIELVDKILADPDHLDARHFEDEIDQLIYRLYRLTEDEIDVVNEFY